MSLDGNFGKEQIVLIKLTVENDPDCTCWN